MIKKNPLKAIAVFYAIALLMRYIAEYTSLSSNLGDKYYEIFTGIGPAIGALIASKIFGVKIPLTLKGNFRNFIIPFGLFWILPILIISTYNYFISKNFSVILCLTILIYGLCEEIGWRGFLQPALEPLPKFAIIFVIAVLWYIWHLNFGLDIKHLLFFVLLFLGSWGIGVISEKTNSLLIVASFHSLNNFFTEINLYKSIILVILLGIWITTIIYYDRKNRKNINQKPL